MRENLNNSPAAQVGVVLVLVVIAFVMFTQLQGGDESSGEEAVPTEATVSVAGTEVTGTATGSTPGEAVEGAVENAYQSASAEASAQASVGPIPAPPLPAPVRKAYEDDRTVVLLLVHDGGIDDKLVAQSTKRLEAFPDTTVFIVPAKQIARYGAITLGVEVAQVPALIVVRPRQLSHGIPQATIDYGFQTQQGIEQAMRDGAYHGPAATYHPD
jgi:hypothetical protein